MSAGARFWWDMRAANAQGQPCADADPDEVARGLDNKIDNAARPDLLKIVTGFGAVESNTERSTDAIMIPSNYALTMRGTTAELQNALRNARVVDHASARGRRDVWGFVARQPMIVRHFRKKVYTKQLDFYTDTVLSIAEIASYWQQQATRVSGAVAPAGWKNLQMFYPRELPASFSLAWLIDEALPWCRKN